MARLPNKRRKRIGKIHFISTLNIIATAVNLQDIIENIFGNDFFINLKNAFDVLPKENHIIIMLILNSLIRKYLANSITYAWF